MVLNSRGMPPGGGDGLRHDRADRLQVRVAGYDLRVLLAPTMIGCRSLRAPRPAALSRARAPAVAAVGDGARPQLRHSVPSFAIAIRQRGTPRRFPRVGGFTPVKDLPPILLQRRPAATSPQAPDVRTIGGTSRCDLDLRNHRGRMQGRRAGRRRRRRMVVIALVVIVAAGIGAAFVAYQVKTGRPMAARRAFARTPLTHVAEISASGVVRRRHDALRSGPPVARPAAPVTSRGTCASSRPMEATPAAPAAPSRRSTSCSTTERARPWCMPPEAPSASRETSRRLARPLTACRGSTCCCARAATTTARRRPVGCACTRASSRPAHAPGWWATPNLPTPRRALTARRSWCVPGTRVGSSCAPNSDTAPPPTAGAAQCGGSAVSHPLAPWVPSPSTRTILKRPTLMPAMNVSPPHVTPPRCRRRSRTNASGPV